MTRPVSLSISDLNGDRHECVAEALNNASFPAPVQQARTEKPLLLRHAPSGLLPRNAPNGIS
jgi:hypothetical protein